MMSMKKGDILLLTNGDHVVFYNETEDPDWIFCATLLGMGEVSIARVVDKVTFPGVESLTDALELVTVLNRLRR